MSTRSAAGARSSTIDTPSKPARWSAITSFGSRTSSELRMPTAIERRREAAQRDDPGLGAGELFRVDLGSLEATRVVDVDRLPVVELLERRRAGFPGVRRTGLLRPAEWQLDLRADRRRVHVRDPGLEFVHRPERPAEVVRVYRGTEPVLDGVRDRDRVLVVLRL